PHPAGPDERPHDPGLVRPGQRHDRLRDDVGTPAPDRSPSRRPAPARGVAAPGAVARPPPDRRLPAPRGVGVTPPRRRLSAPFRRTGPVRTVAGMTTNDVLTRADAGWGTSTGFPVAVRAEAVTKVYGKGETAVRALAEVVLAIPAGRFTAVMGPSGSGKSTLMHVLAGLDTVTSGRVWLGDVDLASLPERELTRLRRDRIGFVFQAFNLLPTLSAAENITLPVDLAGRKPDRDWLDHVIDTVGLRPRLKHRPTELSGGQPQRDRTSVA